MIGTGDGAVNPVGASTCQPDGVRVGTINGSTRYMREFTVAQWVSWEREGDYLEGDGRWSLIPNCKGLWRIGKWEPREMVETDLMCNAEGSQ